MRYKINDFINNECESFAQLAWTDTHTPSGSSHLATDFPELAAWIGKAVGGTPTRTGTQCCSISGGVPASSIKLEQTHAHTIVVRSVAIVSIVSGARLAPYHPGQNPPGGA